MNLVTKISGKCKLNLKNYTVVSEREKIVLLAEFILQVLTPRLTKAS